MGRHRKPVPRRDPTRLLAGAALALALLGAGTVTWAAQDERGTPVTFAASDNVAAPAHTESAATPLPRSEPVHVHIPVLGVSSTVMGLGLQADGSMEVPPGAYPAGWYIHSPTPGELGPSILAAHVDWNGEPGVFVDIRELQLGDEVAVTRQDGSTATFQVDRVDQYPKDGFPTEAVYGDIDHAGLRLVTCGGDFDDDAHSYVDNIVVYASLMRSSQI
jgi:sortase (surface protein transpeptidase)